MIEKETLEKIRDGLDSHVPLIPDVVIDHFLEKAGVANPDTRVKKYISLLAQKFITEVTANAFQYHKINQKKYQKDKRYAKERKITLQVVDLEKALEEMGIDINRPYYYF